MRSFLGKRIALEVCFLNLLPAHPLGYLCAFEMWSLSFQFLPSCSPCLYGHLFLWNCQSKQTLKMPSVIPAAGKWLAQSPEGCPRLSTVRTVCWWWEVVINSVFHNRKNWPNWLLIKMMMMNRTSPFVRKRKRKKRKSMQASKHKVRVLSLKWPEVFTLMWGVQRQE